MPRWVSRILALGLLVLLLAGTAWAVLGPSLGMEAELDGRIVELNRQLVRFEKVAAERDRLKAARDRLANSGATGRYYLAGATPAVAAATLQRQVKAKVTANRGKVISTQEVPARQSGTAREVVVRVQMNGDVETVQRTFHALETGMPYLFLDNLRLRGWGGRVVGNAAGPQVLKVQFDVTAYLQGDDADTDKK